MTQEKVNAFVDRTIGSLCHNAVDLDFIIHRLEENSKKYQESLSKEDSSQTKKNYLIWYIQFAKKRINDLTKTKKIAEKLGKSRPDQVYKLLQLKEKLTHNTEQKVVQFD